MVAAPHPSLYGIQIREIQRICRVNVTTARRWKRGALCPPPWAVALLTGDLGWLSSYWRGWRVQGEEIVPPAAWPIHRDDALSVPLLRAHIQALQAELRALKETPPLQDQPTPEAWVINLK